MAQKTTASVHSTHVANQLEHSSDLLMLDEKLYSGANLTVEMYLSLSLRIEASRALFRG